MCNFGGQGADIPETSLILQASFALKAVRNNPYVHLTPIGSFFDEKEMPSKARMKILEIVRESGFVRMMGTEGKAEDISEDKLRMAHEILNEISLDVGVGLESSDPFVRDFIIHKSTRTEHYLNFYRISRDLGVISSSHVLLKPIFLTEKEAIEDAKRSIEWALNNGSSYVILMVMNIRKGYNLASWLWEKGKYRLPMLWSLIKLLLDLDTESLSRTVIGGLTSSETMLLSAKNCDKCTDRVTSLLNMYQYTLDRNYLEEAFEIDCECKSRWEALLHEEAPPLKERVIQYYEYIARNIFSDRWWEENKKWIISEVDEYEGNR